MELTKADAAQIILSVHAYTPNTPHKYIYTNLQAHIKLKYWKTHDWSTDVVRYDTMSYPKVSMHYLYTKSHTVHTRACTHTLTHTHKTAAASSLCVEYIEPLQAYHFAFNDKPPLYYYKQYN